MQLNTLSEYLNSNSSVKQYLGVSTVELNEATQFNLG